MRRIPLFFFAALALLASGCFMNVSSYTDSDGSIVYVGEVFNGGPPLVFATVEGTFYDSNNNVIATASGEPCTPMEEKTMSAFEVRLPAGTQQPARVEWRLTGSPPSEIGRTDAGLARGLTASIVAQTHNPILETTSFYGEVTNTTSTPYGSGFICAAWIDAAGNVIRVGVGRTGTNRLDPGETASFRIFKDVPATAVGVRMYPDAAVYPDSDPPDVDVLPATAFVDRTEIALDAGSGAVFGGAFGELRNTTGQPRIMSVYAEVRNAAGGLVAASSEGACDVAVEANETSFGAYLLTVPAGSPAPQIKVEATEALFREPISVSNLSFDDNNDAVTVTGTVKNTSGKTLVYVNVCAAAYDSDGNVVGVFPAFADVGVNGLAPNATAEFETVIPAFGTTESVDAIADGAVAP